MTPLVKLLRRCAMCDRVVIVFGQRVVSRRRTEQVSVRYGLGRIKAWWIACLVLCSCICFRVGGLFCATHDGMACGCPCSGNNKLRPLSPVRGAREQHISWKKRQGDHPVC
jgi:hypothetical protein